MRKSALAVIALATCSTLWAQAPAPVGAVAEVHGLVTMSFGSTVATVQPDTPVFDGARFVASSSGGAQLKFSDGCVVKLEPNQWISVDSALDCGKRIASVQTLGGPGTAGGGTTLAQTLVPLAGAAALVGVLSRLPDAPITPTPR